MIYLFSTKFCAKCPGVKRRLRDKGVEFQEMNAIELQNQDLVNKYNIKGVPTLVIQGEESIVWDSMSGDNLEGWINGL